MSDFSSSSHYQRWLFGSQDALESARIEFLKKHEIQLQEKAGESDPESVAISAKSRMAG